MTAVISKSEDLRWKFPMFLVLLLMVAVFLPFANPKLATFFLLGIDFVIVLPLPWKH